MSAAAAAANAVDKPPDDEYMSIAQLRFSAAQKKAGAAEQLLALIKKRGTQSVAGAQNRESAQKK
jgi:hypothetical protein